jgi:hypothetical protein
MKPLYLQKLDDIKNIPVLNQKALHYVLEQGIVHDIDEQEDLWLEFGTFDGRSIIPISEYTNKMIYGFDSFVGLPEDWRCRNIPAGTFNLGGDDPNYKFYGVTFNLDDLKVVPNVEFIKGWFEDTLPKFMEDHNRPISFIHVDSDIYSSAVCIFKNTVKNIKPGCIIVFDELLHYEGFEEHEWKAWWEFVEKYNIEFEWIGSNRGGIINLPSEIVNKKFGHNTPLTPQQKAQGSHGKSPSEENCALKITANPHYSFN